MSIPGLVWQLYCNTKKTSSQIQAIQDQKLRKLLHHAWSASAYYRKSFENHGIREEDLDHLPLAAFPVIDKQTLIENFDLLVTDPALSQKALAEFDAGADLAQRTYRNQYHLVHSSGSTGVPRYFVYDQAAWNTMLAGIIRGALWGMNLSQALRLILSRPKILYVAATDGRYGGAMAVGDGVRGIGAKELSLDINTPFSQWADKINGFQPDLIIGYPSAVKIIAELPGLKKWPVKRVITCGEPLNPVIRERLEHCFSCTVVNFYGCSESLALGAEITDHKGMVLFDDLNILEIENGEVYLTCLYNLIQPLIRYRISDQIHYLPQNGIFSTIEPPAGRNEDILWFSDENGHKDFLHPLSIEGICVEGVLDYQFIQTSADSFEMVVETRTRSEAQQGTLRQKLCEILAQKNLNYVHFSIRYEQHILPDSQTGKKRMVIPLKAGEANHAG